MNIQTANNTDTDATDLSIRSKYGSGYITAMIRSDYDDDDETTDNQDFYAVSVIYPIDDSDWFNFGNAISRQFDGVRFATKFEAVNAVTYQLGMINIESRHLKPQRRLNIMTIETLNVQVREERALSKTLKSIGFSGFTVTGRLAAAPINHNVGMALLRRLASRGWAVDYPDYRGGEYHATATIRNGSMSRFVTLSGRNLYAGATGPRTPRGLGCK